MADQPGATPFPRANLNPSAARWQREVQNRIQAAEKELLDLLQRLGIQGRVVNAGKSRTDGANPNIYTDTGIVAPPVATLPLGGAFSILNGSYSEDNAAAVNVHDYQVFLDAHGVGAFDNDGVERDFTNQLFLHNQFVRLVGLWSVAGGSSSGPIEWLSTGYGPNGEPFVEILGKRVGGEASIPSASTTVKGLIEIATQAEAQQGTDAVRAITPATLAAYVAANGGGEGGGGGGGTYNLADHYLGEYSALPPTGGTEGQVEVLRAFWDDPNGTPNANPRVRTEGDYHVWGATSNAPSNAVPNGLGTQAAIDAAGLGPYGWIADFPGSDLGAVSGGIYFTAHLDEPGQVTFYLATAYEDGGGHFTLFDATTQTTLADVSGKTDWSLYTVELAAGDHELHLANNVVGMPADPNVYTSVGVSHMVFSVTGETGGSIQVPRGAVVSHLGSNWLALTQYPAAAPAGGEDWHEVGAFDVTPPQQEIPPADTNTAGIVRLATRAETLEGIHTDSAVTPDSLVPALNAIVERIPTPTTLADALRGDWAGSGSAGGSTPEQGTVLYTFEDGAIPQALSYDANIDFVFDVAGNEATFGTPFDGTHVLALTGGKGNLSTTSVITTQSWLADGVLGFDLWTSTEDGADFLRVYIDDVQQGQWSGSTPFTHVEYPVSAGVHTVRWSYEKDNSSTDGFDAVFIDGLAFVNADLNYAPAAPAPTYARGDVVRHAGGLYVAQQANSDVEPAGEDTIYWGVLIPRSA